MTIVEAIVLAVVEGVTEFLPVSSTGHMIIASSLMGIASDDFTKTYTVAIQLGAICSVLVLYWRKFLKSFSFYVKLAVGFLPAAVFGFLFSDQIDALLENVLVVAISLVAGGIVLLFIDRIFASDKPDDLTEPGLKQSLVIGVFQCLAMVPGVSRSAATIIGGLTQRLTRKAAAEFSFILAVPTMAAATLYKGYTFYQEGEVLNSSHLTPLLVGNIVAFVIAILAMRAFVGYLTKHGFRLFGWYRIVLGTILLILMASGVDLQIV